MASTRSRSLVSLWMLWSTGSMMTLFSLMTLCSFMTLCSANSDAKRLYDDLIMKGYRKYCRPVRSHYNVTMVRMGLRLSQIVNVDEVNQILTISIWVEQDWHDVRFVWDTRQYNNISKLSVPIEDIWRPDIVLYNNADGDYTVTTPSKASLTPDGLVTWKPPMQFKSYCEMDVEYFPFDEQKCFMKFGPWTHDVTKVDITHRLRPGVEELEGDTIQDAMSMNEYQPSAEWDLMETTAEKNLVAYPCCPDNPYADITFNITLKRRTLYYTYNLIIPCLSINMLTCLSFYLPSYSGEKISITISVFLSLSIFQLLLMDLVPSTSFKVPLIGKYIMMTLLLSTISILINTFILRINHRSSATHEMSEFTRWFFLRKLSKILFIHNPMIEEKKVSVKSKKNYNNTSRERDHLQRMVNGKDDVVKTTFIGSSTLNKLNLEQFCDACVNRRMKKLPPNAQKGLDGVCFIAKHYSDEDDTYTVKDEWRFVALVIDRILLLLYISLSAISAMIICLNAPALYDNRVPLTTTTSTSRIINITRGFGHDIEW